MKALRRSIHLVSLLVFATAACGSSRNGGATASDSGLDVASSSDGASNAEASSDAAVPSDASAEAHVGADASDAGGPAQLVAIPMYVDPTTSAALWMQANAAAPTVGLLVANPASGPGTAADPQYTQAIATAHAAGQSVVGYVHTSYAMRPIAQVEADADSWYAFYPAIDGIFVDETSTDKTTVAPYYQPLDAHVKAEPGTRAHTVVINPGTMIDESFMQAADVVVTFEDTYAHYTNGSYPPNPAWTANYARRRFWHLVLSAATTADMQNAVTIARQRNVGFVYVTDQGPATAYQQIVTGAYWQAELAAVQAP
ncbi:MAG TPA: spherulation-specific family 4 protein [Polyangiaceae bacterium]